jgi:hypothetical protein
MLDWPEDVCPGQVWFEYPATSVPFSRRVLRGVFSWPSPPSPADQIESASGSHICDSMPWSQGNDRPNVRRLAKPCNALGDPAGTARLEGQRTTLHLSATVTWTFLAAWLADPACTPVGRLAAVLAGVADRYAGRHQPRKRQALVRHLLDRRWTRITLDPGGR